MNSETHLSNVLILDDDPDFRKLLVTILGKKLDGVGLNEYDPLAQGVPGGDFDWGRYDVLLLDYYLNIPNVTGLDILQNNRKNKAFPATIMLTGAGNEEVAVRALKSGVYDYLRKETLDKDHLHTAILEAYEKNNIEKQKLNELTNQSHAFNKALFYQELEQKDKHKRVLILIKLDNHETLEQRLGIIFRDNIIRHIAKQSFEVFKLGESNPSITRFGDTSVALLIDDKGSKQTLEFNLGGLCNHLGKHPYKFDGKKIKTTVSLGALCLSEKQLNAEDFIRHAEIACDKAAEEEGNSYYIYADADWQTALDQKVSAPSELVDAEEQPDQEFETEQAKAAPVKVIPEPDKTREERPVSAKEPETQKPEKPSGQKQEQAKPQKKADLTEQEKKELNEILKNIKNAFNEKRTVQTFQPVIPLAGEEEREAYIVAVQIINKDGTVMNYEDIMKVTNIPDFRKFIDRWMLREILGRITHVDLEKHIFFLKISEYSLADATFFDWLRKLLTGLGKQSPGKQIVLELSARQILKVQKQANALMSYLKKSQGFRFVLGDSQDPQEIRNVLNNMDFDLIRTNYETISAMSETYPHGNASEESDNLSILQHLKNNGIYFMADNVEDATKLTEAISAGADYASGLFIGEPMNQLDDVTNVESFEII